MSTPNTGDRVMIVRAGRYGLGEILDGKTGTLVENTRPYFKEAYAVSVDAAQRTGFMPSIALAETVSLLVPHKSPVPEYDPATAEVGDRVTVLRQPRAEKVFGNYEGRVGSVRRVDEPYRHGNAITHRYYEVRLDYGPVVKATKVAVLPTPLADWERELLSGDVATDPTPEPAPAEPAPAELPILVDMKRVQSLKVAQEILGDYPDVDELLRLAEYVENGGAVSDDQTVGVIKRAVDAAQPSPVDTRDDLIYVDIDRDELRVGRANEPEQAVCISTGKDHEGVYLSNDDVDKFVAFVLACRDANS